MINPNFSNTSVIILAGGKSQRAETIKGLRRVNDEYWLDIQVEFFKSIGIKHIFVGLGFDHKHYLNKSKQISQCESIINPNPEYGSFSTLQCVLTKALEIKNNKILLIHIDHALPKLQTIESLLQCHAFDIVKPTFINKSGHPIVLSYCFAQTLKGKDSSSQLNSEIRKLNIEQISWIETNDKNILENLNTKAKWQNYKNKKNNLK